MDTSASMSVSLPLTSLAGVIVNFTVRAAAGASELWRNTRQPRAANRTAAMPALANQALRGTRDCDRALLHETFGPAVIVAPESSLLRTADKSFSNSSTFW